MLKLPCVGIPVNNQCCAQSSSQPCQGTWHGSEAFLDLPAQPIDQLHATERSQSMPQEEEKPGLPASLIHGTHNTMKKLSKSLNFKFNEPPKELKTEIVYSYHTGEETVAELGSERSKGF